MKGPGSLCEAGKGKHGPAGPCGPSRKRRNQHVWFCVRAARVCRKLEGAGHRERLRMDNRKRMGLTTKIFVFFRETLERIVQDIHSHQEFVSLDVQAYLAGHNFFPRRETQDCLMPVVLGQLGA